MKKMITIALLAVSLSSNAFWNNNNNYGGYNTGYYDDNGLFGYNPYDYWDPRWYFEEMENMFDEFDDNGWNNNYYNNPYNYGRNPNGYGFAPNEMMNTPWGPGVIRTPQTIENK
ncbi:MAG: hypothetical protein ISR70_02425 [Candidatus Thioglobus sp.]|nr:hypothetical protein [Candidatus Thioglobus pontius]MBL6976899.1 hypothetical protein [Candidatus Thioglobus sp.]MBL6984579.1 hypothetical protein [Candidatus Thioglobus sp.]